jgi:uncharacterized protein YndB with AHSA1/START domain
VGEELVRTIDLDCGVEHAFAVFTEMIDLWWPRGHRKHRDGTLRLEARTDGALIDEAADGEEWTMGRVVAIEPPHRLAFDWYPGSPVAPTAVEISFTPTASGSRVTVAHHSLPDSRTAWPARVATFASGWETVLPALKWYAEEN